MRLLLASEYSRRSITAGKNSVSDEEGKFDDMASETKLSKHVLHRAGAAEIS